MEKEMSKFQYRATITISKAPLRNFHINILLPPTCGSIIYPFHSKSQWGFTKMERGNRGLVLVDSAKSTHDKAESDYSNTSWPNIMKLTG